MTALLSELLDAIEIHTDCLNDLIDTIREQRHALKTRNVKLASENMNVINEIFFDAQTSEASRLELTKKLAAHLSCEPRASAIEKFLAAPDKLRFNNAVNCLSQAVFTLKTEFSILNKLIEQNDLFTSMLKSECQRIIGENKVNHDNLDFRG